MIDERLYDDIQAGAVWVTCACGRQVWQTHPRSTCLSCWRAQMRAWDGLDRPLPAAHRLGSGLPLVQHDRTRGR